MRLQIRIILMIMCFITNNAFSEQCPSYTDMWANGNWSNDLNGWNLKTTNKTNPKFTEGLIEVAVGYVGNDAVVDCSYNNTVSLGHYRKIYNVIPTPSGVEWVRYDDDSLHCASSCVF